MCKTKEEKGRKVVALKWDVIVGYNATWWAETPFGACYAVWINEKGSMSGDMQRKHKVHSNIEEAKQYCQEDFEKRLKQCYEQK